MPKNSALRAIDLYSGVGGWSLGLRLAGIQVVASYDFWGIANETNFKNNGHQAQTVDIRRLALGDLPHDVNVVVGSPPCTQFSLSNRGGSGDIEDGLQDIAKFLSVVDYLKPSFWAMENVPRVAKVLEEELTKDGALARFRHLNMSWSVFNMEDFGLPQRRKRCIAGNFDLDLLQSYTKRSGRKSLGIIVRALAAETTVRDPIFGVARPKGELKDHVTEDALSVEETRINRAAKTTHPVYNAMPFPDRLDRSVRTITATCTRVSRESIVIEHPGRPGVYRRLTIRERASLQGFPITFQFYGQTYSQKLRMVGNAVPPVFSYYVAQAFKGRRLKQIPNLNVAAKGLRSPVPPPPDTPPDRAGKHFPAQRRFRFAIPSLRLKSGVRFELNNAFVDGIADWRVQFFFGTSKTIRSVSLNRSLLTRLSKGVPRAIESRLRSALISLEHYVRSADVQRMQKIWSHKGPGSTTPFMLLDQLDEVGTTVAQLFEKHEAVAKRLVEDAVAHEFRNTEADSTGVAKLLRNNALILAGLVVGSQANVALEKHFLQSKSMEAESGRRARRA